MVEISPWREAAEISARKKSIVGILCNVAELGAARMEETIGKASLRDATIGTSGGSAKKLTFGQSPIITVIGKAFWDVGDAPKDQSNRRKYMPDYAVWEIHPVMKLMVQPSA